MIKGKVISGIKNDLFNQLVYQSKNKALQDWLKGFIDSSVIIYDFQAQQTHDASRQYNAGVDDRF